MAEPVIPQPASDAFGHLPGPLGLRLDEEFLPLTAVHGTTADLDAILPNGRWQQSGDALLLRYAPDHMLISGPIPSGPFIAVEVGHGLTRFRLRGVEALHFLALYTRADLHSAELRRDRLIRTRLNHYDCLLWWQTTRAVTLLVERPLAQSFADHLRALSLRHDPPDPALAPRPSSPNAPERRG